METIETGYIYKNISVIKDDEYMTPCVLRGGIWDAWLIPYLSMSSKLGGSFVDIGANIGLNTVLFSCFTKTWAFEPVLADVLEKNTKDPLYPIVVANCALSNFDGESEIYLYSGGNQGAHSMEHPEFGQAKRIHVRRLDSFAEDLGQVSFIKIDVEGHEYKVLEGAKEVIQKWHPVICIETFDADRLKEYADSTGYDIFNAPEHNYVLIYRKSANVEQ